MSKVNVTLRKKASLKGDRHLLYLDFYPPITVNGKQTRRQWLHLFTFDHARNPFDQKHNTKANEEATMIWMKRQNELNKPEIYNDLELGQLRRKEISERSFTDYLKDFVIKRQNSSSIKTWESMQKHVHKFAGNDLKFADITEKYCNDFREYLMTARCLKNDIPLMNNTAWLYFSRFKTVIRRAYKDGNLPTYLNDKLDLIGLDETRRNYLTMDELNKLVKEECTNPTLKRAALFSALTGLRFSDIEKLRWDEVEQVDDNYCLKFTQNKTGGIETLPISKQSAAMLGGRDQIQPFAGLRYSPYQNRLLKNWIKAAGISRKISFHSFRHTYATLQLNAGTDIYTVSKMLGHRDLKTTQIYAHVLDKAKREAANRITIKL